MKSIVLALSFFGLLASAEAQTAGSKAAGVVWTLQEPSDSVEFADLAQHGTLAWANRFYNAPGGMLLSRFDASPPQPLWTCAASSEPLCSDAAAEADVCASIGRRMVGGANDNVYTLRVGDSQVLLWSYDYPVVTAGWSWVCVSRDGGLIAASFVNRDVGAIDIVLFSKDSPVPRQVWSIPPGALWAMDMADDGSRLALSIETGIVVVDLATGATLFSYTDPFYVSNRPVALSGDGLTLAFPASGMQIYRWNGSSYPRLYTEPLGGSVLRLALSRDGNTCAWGISFFTYPIPSTEVWTQCLDVPSRVLTMTEKISSSGALQNFSADIELSDDGGILAVAQAGDEPDVVAEVRVFRRDLDTPIFTLNLPGSARDVDVSGDGRWVLVGSRGVHFGGAGGGGRLDLIHVGGDELELRGVPSLGAAPLLTVYGQPGQFASVLVSPRVYEAPIDVGSAGRLWLNRRRLRQVDLGAIGVSGTAEMPFVEPFSAALPGETLYLQALLSHPRHLSSNWLPITVLP